MRSRQYSDKAQSSEEAKKPEENSEEKAADVETRAAVDAVRERRAGEGSGARQYIVREVVEELGILVCDTGVRKDSWQEVRDELPIPPYDDQHCGRGGEMGGTYTVTGELTVNAHQDEGEHPPARVLKREL